MGATYHPTQVARGISTRLMVALHYLTVPARSERRGRGGALGGEPLLQHFSGERYFQHRAPADASSMTRWRQRLGEAGAEQMLRETIAAGIKMGAIRAAQLRRVNVDTTVETKRSAIEKHGSS
jgi:IS5 family transposase